MYPYRQTVSQKGGAGKSTLATCISAEMTIKGKDVLLVDANATQGSARNWAERRAEDQDLKFISCVEKSGNLVKPVADLSKRYSDIVIDTGGQDSEEMRTALLVSDIALIPIRPSQVDIETLVFVAGLVKTAKIYNPDLVPMIVITNGPTNPQVRVVQETQMLLRQTDFGVDFILSNAVIKNRKSYMDAMTFGKGVTEMDDEKATAEIKHLLKEILNVR